MEVLGTAALASFFTPTGHIQSMNKVEKERQAAARQEKKIKKMVKHYLTFKNKTFSRKNFFDKSKTAYAV